MPWKPNLGEFIVESVILEFFYIFELQLPQNFTDRNETWHIKELMGVSEFQNFAPKICYDFLKFNNHVINFHVLH